MHEEIEMMRNLTEPRESGRRMVASREFRREFRGHHTQFLTCSHGSDGLPAWLDWLVSLFLAFHTTSPSGETVV